MLSCLQDEVTNSEPEMNERDVKRPPQVKRDAAVVNKAVSNKLKAYYEDIASQDVPDRFRELLDRLDKQS